ncbi:hypothetical protein L7F22_033094 [Adiantum nelumboides]|nr:hypothetical protein [Adiantum nelumboides]
MFWVLLKCAGILSIFGSGLFLLVQVLILLDFTHNWNAAWVAKDEQFWYVALLVASVISYLGTFTLSGLLYYWFNPSGESCSLNVFFITMTLILAAGFCILSLHPKVNGSLLPAAVISLYCAYVCYTGLSSEPRDYDCNGLHNHSAAVSASTLVLGITTTILSVVYSAVRAGSSTTFLSPPSSPRGGGDHHEDFGNEYGLPLPTQEELREMEYRRLVGEATNLMLNFAKDPKLAKYMSETAFQDVQVQLKATTTSPPKPDSKKQYSEKELEEEIDARLARILGAQKQGKKHERKRKKSTDFPCYLGS